MISKFRVLLIGLFYTASLACLGRTAAAADTPIQCYVCNSNNVNEPDCKTDFPANGAGIPTVTCTGLCIKTSAGLTAADARIERGCSTVPNGNDCVVAGTHAYSCYCETDRCNGEPMLVQQGKLSCHVHKCDSITDKSCGIEPFTPAGPPTECQGKGQPCVTIRTESLFGDWVSVERKCSDERGIPTDGVRYKKLPNDQVQSSSYCSTSGCNTRLTTAYPEGEQPGLSCYTCGPSDKPDSCKKDTFVPGEVEALKCSAKTPCATVRTEKKHGTVVSVERKCAEELAPETPVNYDECQYTPLAHGDLQSTCYCKTDKCNTKKTSVNPPIECHVCGEPNNHASETDCKAANFVQTPNTKVLKCKPEEKCITIAKRKKGYTEADVQRACTADKDIPPEEHGCKYEILEDGTSISRCYCGTSKCNDKKTTATDPAEEPISCYDCGFFGGWEKECREHPFNPEGSVAYPVRTKKCAKKGVACLTIRRKDADGKETVKRDCDTESAPPEQKCISTPPNDDGVSETKCYCTTDKCNTETNPVPQIYCYLCGTLHSQIDCRKNPFEPPGASIGRQFCEPDQSCVTIRSDPKSGDAAQVLVERSCKKDEGEPKNSCVYSETDQTKRSECYCSSNKCNKKTTSTNDPNAKTSTVPPITTPRPTVPTRTNPSTTDNSDNGAAELVVESFLLLMTFFAVIFN